MVNKQAEKTHRLRGRSRRKDYKIKEKRLETGDKGGKEVEDNEGKG